MLNSSKYNFFFCAFRTRAPCFPAEPLLLGSEIWEQIDSHHYLGVKISPRLTTSSKWARKKGDCLACYTDSLSTCRHSNTIEPLPYLCVSSFGVCLQAMGSLHLHEHLYARGSPKVHI